MVRTDKSIRSEAGFSLLEALVAMVVLSVSAKAILSAAEAHTRSVIGLSDRMVALWVAENRLVELGLGTSDVPDIVRMGGQDWHVDAVYRATSDATLRRVDISVARGVDRDAPLVFLTGYLEGGV